VFWGISFLGFKVFFVKNPSLMDFAISMGFRLVDLHGFQFQFASCSKKCTNICKVVGLNVLKTQP